MTATCPHPIESGSPNVGLCHSEVQFRNRSLAAYRRCEYAERLLPTVAVFFWAGLLLILCPLAGLAISLPVSVAAATAVYYSAVWLDCHWHALRQHPAGRRGYRKLKRTERILRRSFEHARKNAGYGHYKFVDERIHLLITEAGATLTFLPTVCWSQGLTLFYSCSKLDDDFGAMRATNLAHFDNKALLAIRQVAAMLFRTERPNPPTGLQEAS